jgi:ATP-dependent DNA ligase
LHPNFPEYVRLSDLLPEDTPMDQLVATLDEHGLEGIVVKRKDSTYLVARWNIRKSTVEYTEKTERDNIRGHGRFGELRP